MRMRIVMIVMVRMKMMRVVGGYGCKGHKEALYYII